jgi:ribosomal protein S18 acetylase RimI-like enzyme
VVRLVADQRGDHELSVAVVDAMHGRGIGSALVDVALAVAGADGIDSVALMIHPENAASVKMFRRMGAAFRFEFGLLVGRLPVRVPVPAEVVAA